MAFRRSFRSARRSPARRGVTAAVERRLDRKKEKQFHWVTLVDNLCSPQTLDCKGCCEDPELPELEQIRGCTFDEVGAVESSQPNSFPLVLVSPADVPGSGEEALQGIDVFTIVKMQGWVEFCPAFCQAAQETAQCLSDPAHCEVFHQFARQFDTYHLRAGLSKDRWELDPLTRQYGTIQRFPLDPADWSDAQFMRQFERFKSRRRILEGIQLNGSAPLGCCGNVSAAAAGAPANTLSNGSGTVNIPAISTDCEPCQGGEDNFRLQSQAIEQYGCFRISLNSRRRLVLRENEGLTLWVDYTSFTPDLAPTHDWRRNVGMQLRTSVRALVEV